MNEKTKILLNKERSVDSVNVNTQIEFNVDNINKPIPLNEINTIVNAYEQFLKERKASSIYRFYGEINALVSNPLYNDNIKIYIDDDGNLTSSKINSSDIFENNGWVGYFTSSEDLVDPGEVVPLPCPNEIVQIFDEGVGQYLIGFPGAIPLTENCCQGWASTIMSMDVYWDGQYCRPDPTGQNQTSGSYVNTGQLQQFNDYKSSLCDFHVFDPGYNRLNMLDSDGKPNYMLKITYPFDTKDIQIVHNNSGVTLKDGIPIIEKLTNIKINGRKYVGFITPINHGLKDRDTIRLYNFIDNTVNNTLGLNTLNPDGTPKLFHVFKLGNYTNDNKFRTFVLDIAPQDIGFTLGISTIKRVVNNNISKYYVRRFKCLTTEYKDYDIYPAAFGVNYYDDKMAAFNLIKDIDVNGLVDNLGRPLSDLFLTIVKNDNDATGWGDTPSTPVGDYDPNQAVLTSESQQTAYEGYIPPDPHTLSAEYWLEKQQNLPDDIKYRFWTRIQAGYKMGLTDNSPIDTTVNYNVRAIGDPNYAGRTWFGPIDESDTDFDADIVEYNSYELLERTLEDIYHRINTIYRENLNAITSVSQEFAGIFNTVSGGGDSEREKTGSVIVLTADIPPEFVVDYSFGMCYSDRCRDLIVCREFSIKEIYGLGEYSQIRFWILGDPTDLSNCLFKDDQVQISADGCPCTVSQEDKYEGYIYKPHSKIPIREFSSFINPTLDLQTVFDTYDITIPIEQDKVRKAYGVPVYATEVGGPGTNIYKWRNLLEIGEIDAIGSSVEYPFESGAHYLHLGNRFYLERQDPPCEFNLVSEQISLPADKGKFLEMITRPSFLDYSVLNEQTFYELSLAEGSSLINLNEYSNALIPIDIDIRFIMFSGDYALGIRDTGGACIEFNQPKNIDDVC